MKITLEVPKEKTAEFMAIIESMDYVTVEQGKPLLLQELEEAVEEVKLARAGKIRLQTLDDLLDEL